ncbi:MAG TPA: hypothetical protein VES73_14320 [Lamprocystis sp. (in: g-proteobacteria)]|nr:hypothetical protein [Lamprocystis sp. (in: g-proteobacteria)]
MRISTMLVPLAASITMMFGVVACDNQGPAERAGAKIDNAAERAGDRIDRAGEKASEKIEAAKDSASPKATQ